jgi:5-methyltetrahydrofolate corrinoid/iron sulfur protein methyltransferase
MRVVGELINASRKEVASYIRSRNSYAIQKIAVDQVRGGADYIDVNAGIFSGREPECLKWLVETVQAAVDVPCSIDSPDPAAITAALSVHKGSPAMINSISLEENRFQPLLSVVAGTDLNVIALCMSDDGMPETVDERLSRADKLINGLLRNNVALDHIYVDCLLKPVSTDSQSGVAFLSAIRRLTKTVPGVHTICGVSNISFGLPFRRLLNRTFIPMAIAHGLDTAIIDPLDAGVMNAVFAARALAGHDEFCMAYLTAFREGKLEGRL